LASMLEQSPADKESAGVRGDKKEKNIEHPEVKWSTGRAVAKQKKNYWTTAPVRNPRQSENMGPFHSTLTRKKRINTVEESGNSS